MVAKETLVGIMPKGYLTLRGKGQVGLPELIAGAEKPEETVRKIPNARKGADRVLSLL